MLRGKIFCIFKKLFLNLFNKFVKHDLDECNLHHGFCRFRQKLIVDGQPSEVLQPCESLFHNPTVRQYLKLGGAFIRPDYDFQYPSELLHDPIGQSPSVASVRQDFR